MRVLALSILCLILFQTPGVSQFEEFEIKSTHVVNAKLVSKEITPSHLTEYILTFEVLDGNEHIPKGTIISRLIDENQGVRSILGKISQYSGEESWEAKDLGPLILKLAELPESYQKEHRENKWLIGWVAIPDRRKSLELLEMKLDSLYRSTNENYESIPGIDQYQNYMEVFPREEDGFIHLRYSKVMIEIPYTSGKWHLGTFINYIPSYEVPNMIFEPHPDNPRIFWERGKEDGPLYFRDLWGRMLAFELE